MTILSSLEISMTSVGLDYTMVTTKPTPATNQQSIGPLHPRTHKHKHNVFGGDSQQPEATPLTHSVHNNLLYPAAITLGPKGLSLEL